MRVSMARRHAHARCMSSSLEPQYHESFVRLTRTSGGAPDSVSSTTWRRILIQLTELSISGRDRIGGHDFDWGTTPSRFNDGAKKAFFDLKKAAKNTVGTSSRSIITYAAIGL